MTINIALATSEGLVLACDSIASSTGYFIPAFGDHVEAQADGKFLATYRFSDVVTHVTNSWGGVTKMFPLHDRETPVAAITAGLAKLGVFRGRAYSGGAHSHWCNNSARWI